MKTYLALLVTIVTVTLVTGCTGLASVAKQLKNDPAFVTVEVKTLYGSGIMVRDGRANNGNVIGADGTVTSSTSTNSNFHPTPVQATQAISYDQLQALVEARARALVATNSAAR